MQRRRIYFEGDCAKAAGDDWQQGVGLGRSGLSASGQGAVSAADFVGFCVARDFLWSLGRQSRHLTLIDPACLHLSEKTYFMASSTRYS
jgi:hypothetical protein